MTDSMRDFKELYGYCFEDLKQGMSAVVSRTVTEADILMFAGVSGDTNPVHLDAEYAGSTMFGGRIAHGMLSAALISAVFGTRLPGPGSIYLSQNLKFKAPVRIGDTVRARVIATAVDQAKGRCTFTTTAHVGDTLVVEGEAQLLVPKRPA